MTMTPEKRRRLVPAERREEILEAAERLISERGYNGVTLQEVADACGMAKSGLLHHFPSKVQLLISVLETRDLGDLSQAEIQHAGELDRAAGRALIDRVVRDNFARRELVRLFMVLGTEALDPAHPAHDYFARRLDSTRLLIREAVSSWHPEPDLAALRIVAFMDGLQLLWLRDPTVPPLDLWAKFADTELSH